MKQLEHDLHRSVAEFLNVALPPDVYWTTIGHGGFPLSQALAGRMKARGLKAGVPDILLVVNGQARFIELKIEGGYLSPAQKCTIEQLACAGASVEICRSILDVQETLIAWGVTLRARAA